MLTLPDGVGGRGHLLLCTLLFQVEHRGARRKDPPVDGKGKRLPCRKNKRRIRRLQRRNHHRSSRPSQSQDLRTRPAGKAHTQRHRRKTHQRSKLVQIQYPLMFHRVVRPGEAMPSYQPAIAVLPPGTLL